MIDPAAVEAEQALLGAVLSDPTGQAYALDYVEAGDFVRPYHRQVFEAMQRIRARSEAPGPHELRAELRADPDMPKNVYGQAWLITDLMHEAARAGHAVAYAGLVAENGIRQGLDISGMRIVQAAELGNDSALEVALMRSADARRELDAAQARWAAMPAEVRKEAPRPPRPRQEHVAIARQARAVRDEIGRLRENLWSETSAGLEERLASIAQRLAEVAAGHADHKERQALRQASREARPSGPEAQAAGARALADLAAGPEALTDVRRWLRPEHFALPEHGEIYAAMRDMHAAGKPVDRITVAREARRRGVDASFDDYGFGAQAPASARAAHQHAVLARIRQAGQDISAEATDPASSPRSLLRTADEWLREVERECDAIRQRGAQVPGLPGRHAGHEPAGLEAAR